MNTTFHSVAAVAAVGVAITSADGLAQVPAPVDARPNILFIMTDDHTSAAMSCYGSVVNQTPHLDRLAAEGMRFTNCFATNAICSPSRASILTGRYSHLNGVPAFDELDGSQWTVAKALQQAGYFTGIVGKWHLKSDPTGFDFWSIVPGQGLYENPVFYDAKQRETVPGYATDVITDRTIQLLKDRPKDKPFFVMCHHKAPHRPFGPKAEYRERFARQTFPLPPTFNDDYAGRSDGLKQNAMRIAADLTRNDLKLTPPKVLTGLERQKWLDVKPVEVDVEVDGKVTTLRGQALANYKYQQFMRDYLACVQSVDDNVGRLMDYLDESGLRDNTIVIYTSDQGFFIGEHGLYDKRYMYEPSIRMPFIVRWPGVTKPGSVQEALTINTDFPATFLDAATVAAPTELQGKSLLPLFKGESPADWRKSFYYRYYIEGGEHNTAAHYGVRTLTHKLIFYEVSKQWELYDLVADPQEMKNLYNDPAQAERAAELKRELARLRAELKDEDQVKPILSPATKPTVWPPIP